MPIGGGNDRLARTETISQRPARDLSLVQIRSDIDVRRTEKFQQLILVHEAIEKDHVLLDTILFGEAFET